MGCDDHDWSDEVKEYFKKKAEEKKEVKSDRTTNTSPDKK
jgi:hypothetical protein